MPVSPSTDKESENLRGKMHTPASTAGKWQSSDYCEDFWNPVQDSEKNRCFFFFPTNSLNIFIQFLLSIWKMYACLPYGKISMYKYMQITHNTPVVNDGYIEEKKQGLCQYVWQAKMQQKIFETII